MAISVDGPTSRVWPSLETVILKWTTMVTDFWTFWWLQV